MKFEEVKRMSWALALTCLYEAAEDNALEVTRKAEAASKEKQPQGGVLGRAGDEAGNVLDSEEAKSEEQPRETNKLEEKKDQLEESFQKLFVANEPWVEDALADALEFSKTVACPRDKEYVQSIFDGNPPAKTSKNEDDPLQTKLTTGFVESVWPALRSRSWKKDEKTKVLYTYKEKTFKSIPAILDVVPKYHPELANAVNSLISSATASCHISASSTVVATLDLKTVTAKSLHLFLMDCAPLQLLADRKKAHRISLTKRLLAQLAMLQRVHQIVSTADSALSLDAMLGERNVQLSKLIPTTPRSSLPHPKWTALHDAILIRAVMKHGWIDKQETCLAIGRDKTIHWGVPFEDSDKAGREAHEKEADLEAEGKSQAAYGQLSNAASRALTFLKRLNEEFTEALTAPIINEICERLITSFGLVQDETDDIWKVDENELKKIFQPADEALPSRKRLIKRMKKLANSLAGKINLEEDKNDSLQEKSATPSKAEPISHGFHLIDQSDRHNVLLAAMVRVQLMLKATTKSDTVKSCTSIILGEIDARVDDLANSDGNEGVKGVLTKTRDDIQLYSSAIRKSNKRGAKNILRVMLGIDPVAAKLATEPLFATEIVKPSPSSKSIKVAKAALTKLKRKQAFTPADSALNRALTAYVDNDGTKDCLLLTSTEILILTVLASQGLPVFSEDWSSLFSDASMMKDGDDGFRINFSTMGGVLQAASEVWFDIAKKKLEAELLRHNDSQLIPEKDQQKIAVLKKDQNYKEMTLKEATSYNNDTKAFSKKCIVLVEALRKYMGSLDLQYAGEKKIRQLTKSENGLGPKVLNWLSKDLQKWAGVLSAIDRAGKVNSTTSITSSKDHPQSHDAAMMTKRDCRTVFVQIAQQTRLRSVFVKNKRDRLTSELIPKVLKQSSFALTSWEDCPTWWNETEPDCGNGVHDFELLEAILDYGYGGFDSLIKHDYSFCRRFADRGNDKTLTRATVQVRINQITRELHAIDETEEMMKLVEKTKRKGESSEKPSNGKSKKAKTASIQSGLQAFFKQKKKGESPSPKKPKTTPPTSPEESDVEIIEINSGSSDENFKKQHDATQNPQHS